MGEKDDIQRLSSEHESSPPMKGFGSHFYNINTPSTAPA